MDTPEKVLIDTWWNVNQLASITGTGWAVVLIDTWWNVNEYCMYILFKIMDSFNRYMVECEFFSAIKRLSVIIVLIDTWWNVNIQTRKRIALHHIVLIDTWWNVNW